MYVDELLDDQLVSTTMTQKKTHQQKGCITLNVVDPTVTLQIIRSCSSISNTFKIKNVMSVIVIYQVNSYPILMSQHSLNYK